LPQGEHRQPKEHLTKPLCERQGKRRVGVHSQQPAEADQPQLLDADSGGHDEQQAANGLRQALERHGGGESDRMPQPAQYQPGLQAAGEQA
jgi:hypothetical protein